MLKLKRLLIKQFRRVRPGTELHFDDRYNLVLGENGTGKTTLLELISAIFMGFSDFQQEAFDVEFVLSAADVHVSVKIVNRAIDTLSVASQLSLSPIPAESFRTTATLTADRDQESMVAHWTGDEWQIERGELRIDAEAAKQGSPFQSGYWWFILYATGFEIPRPGFIIRFDEGLNFFRVAYRRSIDLIADPAAPQSLGGIWSVLGNTLGTKLKETPDLLLWHDRELPFLARSAAEMGFARAELHANLLERKGQKLRYGNLTARFIWPGGDFVSHEQLSYGQKRLLSFLHYLAINPHVVIADELVNGLHHRWLEMILNELGDRQAFLTSQNPLLFDMIPFASAQELRDRLIICSQAPDTGGGQPEMVWLQMSDARAQELYAAYDAGLEHTGEILRTRGLW